MKTRIIALMAMCCLLAFSCKSSDEPGVSTFTVTFDTDGGTPVPPPQTVEKGGFAIEPSEAPVKGTSTFTGWYSTSGLKYNFKSSPVSKDITLVAHYWDGPKKYIVINDPDWSYIEQDIYNNFGDSKGNDVAVGQGVLIYIFERSLDKFEAELTNHLKLSLQYNIPLLVEFDPITFWDNVPELWNWFDPTLSGYDDANRENVEWTSWSSQDAVKLGWLDWGTQIRIRPMANLYSKKYQEAVKQRMDALLTIVSNWYKGLPEDKKYLLIGVKITGELAVGVNNWYYTNGNDLYGKDSNNDPTSSISMYNKPSRSNGEVSTIGYASVKSAGIKTSGLLTGDDIAELEKRYTLFISNIAKNYSIPRNKLFAHSGGVGTDLDACINDVVCPAWSFYGADAKDAKHASYCLNLFKNSTAPHWGIAEWAISSDNPSDWSDAIRNAFDLNGCYFLSVYTNVLGNGMNNYQKDNAAIEGIKTMQSEKY